MTSALGGDAAALADQITGEVVLPGTDRFDDLRAVWNAMVDRAPRAIVRCADASDVAAAVRFARERDLDVGVRCGGHSVVGHAVPADGLMIDLRPMAQVRVDAAQRRARVQGGAMLGALDQASLAHGLATTAGNVSHTGVGGLTLGGGMGWLAREHGLTCDNVVSFEVVTADGSTVHASATQNPDLYWGLRGGGGNFGIVTEFEFQLHPVSGRAVIVDLWFLQEDAPAAMRGWRDLIAGAPRSATLTAWVGDRDGVLGASLGFVWTGDPTKAGALLSDLRAIGRPADERVEELSYLDLQRMDDNVEGHKFRRYWKGHYLRDLSDGAIDAFLVRGTADGSGEALPYASLQTYGGAIADMPDDATAFSHRDTVVEFVAAAKWTDAADDEARIGAARRYGAAMEPFASGAYVNALIDEGAAGVKRAYSPEKLARLTAIKNTWDPDNVFHLNHNIVPGTT